ncbi:MAG: hypothetical protein OXT65_07010 [Alphaproteobacteria bacterium]|nr:hypothetical protein [Alphaproteobacteria bacterium]
MAYQKKTKHPDQQNGNVLFLVLIAVALFAALSYAVTQSGRGSGSVDKEQVLLQAAQITQHAAMIQSTVQRMILSGTAPENISFLDAPDPGYGGGYGHTVPRPDSDKVFNPAGGGLTYTPPDTAWLDSSFSANLDYADWIFPNDICVNELPVSEPTCTPSQREMLVRLNYVTREICLAINTGLGLSNPGGEPPVDSGNSGGAALWKNTPATNPYFHLGDNLGGIMDGQHNGCLRLSGGSYLYFHVFYAR